MGNGGMQTGPMAPVTTCTKPPAPDELLRIHATQAPLRKYPGPFMFSHLFVFLEKSSGNAGKNGSFRKRRQTRPVPGYQDHIYLLCSHTNVPEIKARSVGNFDPILHNFGSHLQSGPKCAPSLVKEANGRSGSCAGH